MLRSTVQPTGHEVDRTLTSGSHSTFSAAALSLALTLSCAAAAVAQTPPPSNSLSATDCSLLAAYRYELVAVEVQTSTRQEILRQLETTPPVALVDGYWVSPIDILLLMEVAAGLDRSRFVAEGGERRGLPRDLVAFAFTPAELRDTFSLPYVGKFGTASAPPAAEERRLVIVPVKDGAEVVVEYMPPPIPVEVGSEPECYYFCGDPADWDFDADGTPNAADPDDDGDGVSDSDDAYPYWQGESRCDCGDRDFVSFTGKFSAQVTAVVLSAYDRLLQLRSAGDVVTLYPKDAPLGISLALSDPRCRAHNRCPDPEAPGVRYVSEDPEGCALIRFRCEEGEVGFSDKCGCGCQPGGG